MTLEEEGRSAANAFRDAHRLGVLPLGDLVSIIEQTTGCDVAIIDADPDEHGLTMRDPSRGDTYIGVARTPHPMRHRSTLAHELAHVVFDDWGQLEDPGTRSPQEIRADAFARHFLLPVEGLRSFLGTRAAVNESDLSAVVQHFLVSPMLAAIALHEAGYVDLPTKKAWMRVSTPELATRHGWRDHYDSLRVLSDRSRAPQKLLERATRGYSEGVVSAQTIATLRGVTAESAKQQLQEAGLSPAAADAEWIDVDELPEVSIDLSDLDDESPTGETE